eukprot:TRINITY_DN76513_c0_g1_i1.p1 TRINITY_DN76513_c0_g1~~TRINITY_DN76513_c0_g1_i1.p1  ORF type:complete len:518 (-),score=82.68 TRINITY_DN76513_c0_g1_i1:275-1828(-)
MGSAASVDPGSTDIRSPDKDSIHAMFCRLNSGREGAIRLEDLMKTLSTGTGVSEKAVHLFCDHLDADSDGHIDYAEFSKWLCSSASISKSSMLQECRCPDGHEFGVFVPETDGWCCEECGDDLQVSHESLRCQECGNLCWCLKCTLRMASVEFVEAFTLATVKLTASACLETVMDVAPSQGSVLLKICSLSGPLCEVEADLQWKVIQLKQEIQRITAIAEIAQSLIYESAVLHDDSRLESLQIPHDAVVILLKRTDSQVDWLKKINDVGRALWSGSSLLSTAPPEIREDPMVVLQAVARRASDFQYASDDLRGNRDIALAAINKAGMALIFAADELLDDQSIVDMAFRRGFRLRLLPHDVRSRLGDRENIAFSAVCYDDHEIQHVSNRLLANRCFAHKLLKASPRHWCNIAQDLLMHTEIVEAALEFGFSLEGLPSSLRANPNVVLLTVQRKGMQLKYASKQLQANREIVLAAVQNCGAALQYASSKLRNDEQIVAIARKQDAHALNFANPRFRQAF